MATHPVLWTSPQPLWGRFETTDRNVFRADDQARPALLRFASDEFMQQVISILETDPRRIGDAIARPETWRDQSGVMPTRVEPDRLPRLTQTLARLRAGAAPSKSLAATSDKQRLESNGATRELPLKFYQPAHQRFYLVAASIVCRVPGFPDHTLATGGREEVGFVLRRLLPEDVDKPNSPVHEYAFVKDARGPHWERVPRNDETADHYAAGVNREELLPLFPLMFTDDARYPRRILSGFIPVGRREEYMGSRKLERPLTHAEATAAAPLSAGENEPATKISARKEQLKFDVTEPWKALIRAAYKAVGSLDPIEPPGDRIPHAKAEKTTREFNEGAQLQSWLILLDFADYLALHLPTVWEAVKSPGTPPPLDTAKRNLFDWINASGTTSNAEWRLQPTSRFVGTLREALQRISKADVRKALEGADCTFVAKYIATRPWPDFYFLLAGIREQWSQPLVRHTYVPSGVHKTLDNYTNAVGATDDIEVNPESTDAELDARHVDKLVRLVIAAIDVDAVAPAPPVPFAAQVRDALKKTNGDEGWFVIRCSYSRYDCGPLAPAVFSAPSQKFQLASFFDPDAPARPIRIALPFDTTAAGMRKHQKNTAFVLSDVLCGQVNRLKGLGFIDLVLSVLPWPFHKDLDIGSEGLGPCKDNGVSLGMICSLSIPIITICALILLFMIVLVLDIIFKWIPWFIICFPLPKFNAKKAEA